MNYESGTRECHVLIDSKMQIEYLLYRLSTMNRMDKIVYQLLDIYEHLDSIHEEYKSDIKDEYIQESLFFE